MACLCLVIVVKFVMTTSSFGIIIRDKNNVKILSLIHIYGGIPNRETMAGEQKIKADHFA